MNTSDYELPLHLYLENDGPEGAATQRTFDADRLVAWSEDGRGDAIDTWCRQICDRKIKAINRWEDERILQLEDEWIDLECGNDEDEDEDEEESEEERRYHRACEAVTRQAAIQRGQAEQQMAEHRAAIEQLVGEAREYIAANQPPPRESHMIEWVFGLAAAASVGYVLLT